MSALAWSRGGRKGEGARRPRATERTTDEENKKKRRISRGEPHKTREESRRARRRVRGTRTSPSPGHPASTKRCRANVYKVCRKIARLLPNFIPLFRLFIRGRPLRVFSPNTIGFHFDFRILARFERRSVRIYRLDRSKSNRWLELLYSSGG